ncbi:hypothetical protein [Phreatobacter stygius]|uniref:Uncharacterized protein n=1 Tax=Phreatobacter stygius TaxID=1940610 RepID=A0A4D7BBS1_9HYPH|nr:hypothetical protein [Phreatobacter stygius]QCI68190.1 hypothetical protein E8M01_30565 [Phreatobacter stygius]
MSDDASSRFLQGGGTRPPETSVLKMTQGNSPGYFPKYVSIRELVPPGRSEAIARAGFHRSVAMPARPVHVTAVMAMAAGMPVRVPVRVPMAAAHLERFGRRCSLGDSGDRSGWRADRDADLGSLGSHAAGDGGDGNATDQRGEESATIQHGKSPCHDVVGRPD